jgi:hypothetical protein
VGADLMALLERADLTSMPDILNGSVLWPATKYLAGLVEGMQDGTYDGQPIMPSEYVPVRRLPAGWDTVLELQKLTSGGSRSDAYTAGAAFAHEKIVEAFPARGTDVGDEPLHSHIARVAWQLHGILNQIGRPDDDAPGGGNLILMQCTAVGIARTMNQGLFIHYGVVPTVSNPGYLPPENWKARLQEIRDLVPERTYDAENAEAYDYYEGVRWTCAKFRDLCRDVTDKPRYLFLRQELAPMVTHD